jgi:amidase
MAAEQVSWQDKASKKKAAQFECIPEAWRLPHSTLKALGPDSNVLALPETCGLLSPEELEITSKYDLVALSEKLGEGSLSATAVATAFCKRAAIAHQAAWPPIF